MKDKNRITVMVCTSPAGKKVPLYVVGTAKRPHCFSLVDKPPISYFNQANAWFDKKVMVHWLKSVLAPYFRARFGSEKIVLLLDNCPAHLGIVDSVPSNILEGATSGNELLDVQSIISNSQYSWGWKLLVLWRELLRARCFRPAVL